jgi:hypothetical protein
MDYEECDEVKSDPLTEDFCGHQDFLKKISGKEGGESRSTTNILTIHYDSKSQKV